MFFSRKKLLYTPFFMGVLLFAVKISLEANFPATLSGFQTLTGSREKPQTKECSKKWRVEYRKILCKGNPVSLPYYFCFDIQKSTFAIIVVVKQILVFVFLGFVVFFLLFIFGIFIIKIFIIKIFV